MRASVLRDIRRGRFWKAFATHVFAGVGVISFLFGLYDVLEPDRIAKAKFPFLLAIIAVSIIYAAVRSYPRPVAESYSKPKTEIQVIEGDLFTQADNKVIGMTTTFDTEIPHVINPNSVQGQFLAQIYSHDVAALDKDLDALLANISPSGSIQKPGKSTQYPIGTVVTIRHTRKHYFCVAYGEMDANNQAQASIDGIWLSLGNLWHEVRAKANGDPVAIPVVAGGLARLSQVLPAQDSIRLIAMSFMFASRHSKVCDKLEIVVHPNDIEHVDMLEIQAFLTSLKEA